MRKTPMVCLLVAGLAALVVVPRQTAAPVVAMACATPSEADAAAALARWERTFASGDPEAVTALYPHHAILMGIGETSIAIGAPQIAGHYTRLLQVRPTVATRSRSIVTTCGLGIVHGRQVFGVVDRAVEVDFRMVFMATNGKLELLHHYLDTAEGLASLHSPSANSDEPRAPRTTGAFLRREPLPVPNASGAATSERTAVANTDASPSPHLELSPRSASRTPSLARPIANPATGHDDLVPAPPQVAIGPFPHVPELAVVVPDLKIELGRFPDLVPPRVEVPRLAIAIGPFPPVVAEVPQIAIEIPRLALDIGRFPTIETGPVAGSNPQSDPTRVAGFNQRSPEPQAKDVTPPRPATSSVSSGTAKTASRPKQAKATPSASAPATGSSSSYRVVKRWEGQTPVFDD